MSENVDLSKYTFTEDSFKFANEGVKMSDTKLDTKPSTFAKDSFKRFCKNKSSVVAAIILGILIILAILVPLCSPHSTTKNSAPEAFLEPKLFKAGTGFWDGTRKIGMEKGSQGVVYDTVNECPANYYKPAVLNLKVDSEPSYINQANQYGKGGYVMFENQRKDGETVSYLNSDLITVTKSGNFAVTLLFGTDNGIGGSVLSEFRVLFRNDDREVLLKDWSADYSDLSLNISNALPGDVSEMRGSLSIELKSVQDKYSYVLIKSCVFSSDFAYPEDAENECEAVSFSDATKMILMAKDANNNFPRGYWSSTGRKGIYRSEVYYCSFVYDTYAAVYDETSGVVVSKTELDEYISKGYCEYSASVGPSSFKRLSDKCPITSVTDQQVNSITGRLLSVTTVSYRYAKMGYDKAPKFIFGTDANGYDVFTKLFAGLFYSLGLGFFTFLFCFTFGLIWGSVSGYFGGTVDIVMERFCDILGGVPWIVIMTLCILHLGNNFTTFFLALCLTGWMGTAGGTRTQFYRFKRMEYVLASRTLGSSDIRLIFKHILPNSLGTIVTSSVLMIPSVIFSESTLAYLNLGLQGVPSYGVMLAENQSYIQTYPYLIVIPSVIMALLMISFNLFGNGLRDAINPTLKGSN